ncbi:MAG: serine--tRNA ligase [Firmicutes bacterium]|uniref:Serine--tRNA ligase n=1 Tax=Candidatus Onthovivens merdipullorum TaxID=2840889 RepID=A0A9D9GU49_9BACL|nr:serine--tRNA ligase [Candidatus Onthovivens merdipullorum]
MIDVNLILENREHVEELLERKKYPIDLKPLVEKINEKKKLLHEVETNKAEQNKLSKSVPQVKKEGGDVTLIFKKVKELSNANKANEEKLEVLEKEINEVLYALPNLPDEDLLPGGKENNKPIYYYKEKPNFSFKIKNHVELAESLGLIDYERAAKISGHGTWIYTDLGARLEWALINYFIDNHLKDGFRFMLPPHILNYESGFTAGQFPKFEQDVFELSGFDNKKFLLPTAETALVNLHRNEVLSSDDLPKKYFAYTPCYRKEAGSYRTEERGMIRGYQFNKVEMVEYTKDDDSDRAFEELLNKAKRLIEGLGLHYRISKLAAADCSHSMARTYDLEVYLPSIDIYKEVSSVSNARSYQARRGMIRYKDENGKMHYCHTLNGSGLATSRVFPAILEQYQNEDGSVTIPEVLRPYMGGLSVITPKK